MYKKKALKYVKYGLIQRVLLYRQMKFFFVFEDMYLTFSDYVFLKQFLLKKAFNLKKFNSNLVIVVDSLSLNLIESFLDLLLKNDLFNYINIGNKKNFKLQVFPVKLKFLYLVFLGYYYSREYVNMLFAFFVLNYNLILNNQFFIIIIYILLFFYKMLNNFTKLIKE